MKNSLVISEKFYSIQGEGQTMGVPSIFVRLAGCNILCQSDSWTCDSIEVWKKGTKTPFEDVLTEKEVDRLSNGAHLIFTGGEPLLHQVAIVEYLKWFYKKYEFQPIIEVETNGTIMPNKEMIMAVKYWNCSPKLANSGETAERRIKPAVIERLNNLTGSIFKFVIDNEFDMEEISIDYGKYLSKDKVVLMPAGDSQEKLKQTRQLVAALCIKHRVRYSERLHIVIWNQKTGV